MSKNTKVSISTSASSASNTASVTKCSSSDVSSISSTTDTISSNKPNIHSVEWTDYVLSLLNEDEKIKGNPTTDGLRRVFEIALDCYLTQSTSETTQVPNIDNEKRATVVHSLCFILKDPSIPEESKYRSVSGAADVYWGNCDKIYRNHPVAVAETRAEGRALRRALKLRKVVAAEEIVENVEDHINGDNINKINNNQINFIDVLGKRLNINITKLVDSLAFNSNDIYNMSYDNAVIVIKKLSELQQKSSELPENIAGYNETWKDRL